MTIYGKSLGYGPANGWATIGGTSSATPIWAAMLALVNASPACSADKINGVQDVGFASPILYGIAANPTAYARSFNDIVSGNNDDYGLDNGLVFPAHPGYDMASGLGSPQLTTPTGGNALAFYMCEYAGPTAQTTVSGLSPSSGSTAGGYTVTVSGSGFGTARTPGSRVCRWERRGPRASPLRAARSSMSCSPRRLRRCPRALRDPMTAPVRR